MTSRHDAGQAVSQDRAARAAELREQLSREQPEMLAFMDEMKRDFGASVLYVKTDGIETGKEPAPGTAPYAPLPGSTWPYAVGESPSAHHKVARKGKKR